MDSFFFSVEYNRDDDDLVNSVGIGIRDVDVDVTVMNRDVEVERGREQRVLWMRRRDLVDDICLYL